MPCREHLSQLRQAGEQLKKLNVVVKVITFDADILALAYAKETELDWPLLVDKERSLYKAYGMLRGSWWSIYSPSSIWKYLKGIFRGQRPGKPGQDWSQLGGDVLIDPEGIVRLHYISRDPHDRPSVSNIVEVIERNSKPKN